MISTSISQLNRECTAWRNDLKEHRNQLIAFRDQLREVCAPGLTNELLVEIGHFENQFHIQLINIHDLRQALKRHDRLVTEERKASDGLVSESTLNEHENLFDDFQRLENTIHDIRQQYNLFLRQVR